MCWWEVESRWLERGCERRSMEGRDHTGQAAAPFTALLPMTPRIPGVRNQIRNALYLHVVFAAIGGSVLGLLYSFVVGFPRL